KNWDIATWLLRIVWDAVRRFLRRRKPWTVSWLTLACAAWSAAAFWSASLWRKRLYANSAPAMMSTAPTRTTATTMNILIPLCIWRGCISTGCFGTKEVGIVGGTATVSVYGRALRKRSAYTQLHFLELPQRKADGDREFRPDLLEHGTHERGRFGLAEGIRKMHVDREECFREIDELLRHSPAARKHDG